MFTSIPIQTYFALLLVLYRNKRCPGHQQKENSISGFQKQTNKKKKHCGVSKQAQTLGCIHSLAAVAIDKELTRIMFDYVDSPTFIK